MSDVGAPGPGPNTGAPPSALETVRKQRNFLGHPAGLYFLFFTEMWERFSYYGMRALLVLYMVSYLIKGAQSGTSHVLGFAALQHGLESMFGPLAVQPLASQIYGIYTALVYLTPIFGGNARGSRARAAQDGDTRGDSDGHRTFSDGGGIHVFAGAACPDPGKRLLQAESGNADRESLPYRRSAARSRVYDLLRWGKSGRVPFAAGLRNSRAGIWLAVRIRGSGRRHGNRAGAVSRGPALPASGPTDAREGRSSRNNEIAAQRGGMESDRGPHSAVRTQRRLLGCVRAAGEHDAALRGSQC